MIRAVATLVMLITMITVPATAASAATTAIHVYPGDSIQATVDAALPGDTIIVHKGVYHQSVKIGTDDITLKGAGAILDGNLPADPGTTFLWEDSGIWKIGIWLSTGVSGITVTGFEIRDYGGLVFGVDWGIGIWLDGSHDNHIINNELTDSGIMASGSDNNIIEGNNVSGSMGGITLERGSHYNRVIKNKITGASVGIMLDEGSNYNIIEKNKVANSGLAGIVISGPTDQYGTWEAHDNAVINNKVTSSGLYGIILAYLSSDNLVKGNKVSDSGIYDLCEIELTGTGNVWEDNIYETFGIGEVP